MAENCGINPIGENEVLYRRISVAHYVNDEVLLEAFLPTPSDDDGLSLAREVLGPSGAAATGRNDRQFYVAEIRRSDLPEGVTIIPDSDTHAFIPQLTHQTRRSQEKQISDQVKQRAEILRLRCANVTGPYPGRAPPPPPKP